MIVDLICVRWEGVPYNAKDLLGNDAVVHKDEAMQATMEYCYNNRYTKDDLNYIKSVNWIEND